MKKSVMSTAAAVVLGLLMSGCGGNTPDGTVVDYVNALSKGDLETAKKFASGSKLENLTDITRECSKTGAETLKAEMNEIYQTVINNHNPETEQTLKQNFNELVELGKTLSGGGVLFGKIDETEKKKKIDELVNKLQPAANQIFTQNAIKSENEDAMKKLVVMALSLGDYRWMLDDDIIPDIALELGIAKVTPECVIEKSGIGTVDELNVIETKQGDSADKAEVRLEIIDENGGSNKKEFTVEKIKDEWKVK